MLGRLSTPHTTIQSWITFCKKLLQTTADDDDGQCINTHGLLYSFQVTPTS